MRDLARIFTALSDPTRLETLALLLRHDKLCVCDIVAALGISQSRASRHLRFLWNAGLLTDRPSGQWVHYSVSPDLDANGKTIVAMLRTLLNARDLSTPEARLKKWLCGKPNPSSTARAPGRKPARTKARV
jgi:ArsR family transcriptional regulator